MPDYQHGTATVDSRIARLQAMTSVFSESLTSGQVIQAVTEHLVSSFGARAGLVALLTDDGLNLEIAHKIGYDDPIIVGWSTFPLHNSFPLSDAVRELKPVLMSDGAAFRLKYPALADAIHKKEDEAAAAFPVLAEGRAIGGVYLTFPTQQVFDIADVEFLSSLAHLCGQALARARLYEEAQSARAAVEEAVALLREESEERQRTVALAVSQNRILESIAHGKPIDEILMSIVLLVDSQIAESCTTISIFDPNLAELHLAAGPGLPQEYAARLSNGVRIGEGNGSCAAAAYRKEVVVTANIGEDPRWLNARELPLAAGFCACSSTPILGNSNHVLGTLGLFSRQLPPNPLTSPVQSQLVDAAVHLARIAIERDRVDSGRRAFLAESLAMVTEGHLMLCRSFDDLPHPRPAADEWLPITRATMAELRNRARSAALDCGFSQSRCDDLVTGATEAAANSIMHADETGSIWIRSVPEAGCVYIWITDRGAGIEDDKLHHATLERGWTTSGTLGHGFWIMLRMIDCTFLLTGPSGTTVILEQRRLPSSPEWMAK